MKPVTTSALGIAAALTCLATTASCAQPGTAPVTPAAHAEPAPAAAQQRAATLAQAWQASPGRTAWQTAFIPLQDRTVVPTGVTLTAGTKRALAAGWYQLLTTLPAGPAAGKVTFGTGPAMTVPLVDAKTAYAAIDHGDAPPCKGGPQVPPPGLDQTEPPAAAPQNCTNLTITKVRPGTVDIATSRGLTQAPAWLFTVRELGADVARVAVADKAITIVPPLPVGPATPGSLGVEELTSANGSTVTFTAGGSACDKNVRPTVYETDSVVVLGALADRGTGICTRQLVMYPQTVTLATPLGTRAILDSSSGQLLTVAGPQPE